MYVCMYKLYLMTVKTWLQRNLPQGRLVSKISIEKQYYNIDIHTDNN